MTTGGRGGVATGNCLSFFSRSREFLPFFAMTQLFLLRFVLSRHQIHCSIRTTWYSKPIQGGAVIPKGLVDVEENTAVLEDFRDTPRGREKIRYAVSTHTVWCDDFCSGVMIFVLVRSGIKFGPGSSFVGTTS